MQQQQTIPTYLQAIEIYNAALMFAPHDWKILKRKARACEQLSQLYSQQQQYEHAIDTLKQAVAGYEMEFSRKDSGLILWKQRRTRQTIIRVSH
ncbi:MULTISPECIES: hypothetical protein [Nostoc]|uniref:Tetratricopeptide repeat protein n=1 Tax=Nostoc paludosum FACHB-159 TaxID=2692908 RepID=A0ABR8KJZ3_9NOSO|nr:MULTISPECIES: hypothetical protein [Nostoc]MBD2739873.1 hypothetical protein [Nostoc paludosum FACHB-159]